ncbi:MAG: hypothetical protein ACQETQ_04350 [Spirochaetota bacterium]
MSLFFAAVLNVGFAAVIYLLLIRRIDRKLEPGRIVEQVRSEIEGIIVELNQTTDRNIGLIEDRVNRLNSVLEQADKRLSVLKREVQSHTAGTERYNDIIKRSGRPTTVSRERPGGGEPAGPENAGPGTAGTRGASKAASEAAGDSTTDRGEAPKTDSRAARRKEIVELHRKGIASNIIANRTGTTIGEVELIISLNDRKE